MASNLYISDYPEEEAAEPKSKRLTVSRRTVIWAGCIGWTIAALLGYFVTLAQSKSAIHEIEAAAALAAWVVTGYVLARSIDCISGGGR